ncbi:colanic acid biosynthesis glycosyltransferase WcaL [Pseudoalteromonas citrea]|uniref:Colanic acid biosynthesis glycosyltransferase WcaL n=1 Tax=Pseudoalteromonas citrea TaxID=43655 RepID=A0A5S3XPA0_9GAMM|nr:glycosyltransferase [Pseudoalteromonas citrea]TMP45693.1 colanic acid biosynthesis glycosyltransferase WcaL [Pseudoalteromonas citrea]TMP59072.1 colanic acid biosynthesis glycosyltransferase WcaL [Pseudoalteromonas citrea]
MKIAIFIDVFPIASQTFVLNQITTLIDLGIDVEVVALYAGDQSILEQPELAPYTLSTRCRYLLSHKRSKASLFAHRLYHVGKGLLNTHLRSRVIAGLSPRFLAQATNLMLSTIAAGQKQPLEYDWVIAHFGSSGVVANHLRQIGVLQGNIATVFHGHDITAELSIKNTQAHYVNLFTQTELLLPISNLWKAQLLTLGANDRKIRVQRMGVDLSLFSAPSQRENKADVLNIFTVARFSEKKGLSFALNALAKLPSDIDFQYHLAGYGELEESLKQLVQKLGLASKVKFLGPLKPEQVAEKMHWADVFLQPSITASNGDKEGVPVSIMEAMASNVAVVSTFHSGIPELIEHQRHGLLAPEKDTQALAKYIELLACNPKRRTELTEAAKAQIEQLGDVKRLNQDLVHFLEHYRDVSVNK